jgi:flagellar biosynthesis/type III secretory pathway M-ring protein FliF/YscJ
MTRWFERVALGAIMGVVVFVVERRLVRAIRQRGDGDSEREIERGAQLTVAPEQVEE